MMNRSMGTREAGFDGQRIAAVIAASRIDHHLQQWRTAQAKRPVPRQKAIGDSVQQSLVHLLNRTSFGIAGPDLEFA
ncbi:MAG: hypothetical protein AAF552_17530, partial [Pseudomonadota bacterium]